jgi:hypothetical protein
VAAIAGPCPLGTEVTAEPISIIAWIKRKIIGVVGRFD